MARSEPLVAWWLERRASRHSSQERKPASTRWLFDQDAIRFGVGYSPPVGGFSSSTALLPAAQALAGVGWAFTSGLNGVAIANLDLASNYFEQDLAEPGERAAPLSRFSFAASSAKGKTHKPAQRGASASKVDAVLAGIAAASACCDTI